MNEDDARKAPGLVRSLKWARRVAGWSGLFAFWDWMVILFLSQVMSHTSHHGRGSLDAILAVIVAVCVALGVALLAILLVSGMVAIVQQTRLRNLLRAANGMLCPGCGYDLTGVGSGRCPECGRKYQGTTVVSEWKDEYATALPPWSPLDAPSDGGGGQDKERG
jgi:hypothetical protein